MSLKLLFASYIGMQRRIADYLVLNARAFGPDHFFDKGIPALVQVNSGLASLVEDNGIRVTLEAQQAFTAFEEGLFGE